MNIIPDNLIDTFYKQIKRCIDEGTNYEHYTRNILKLNDGRLPKNIDDLIKSKIKKSI